MIKKRTILPIDQFIEKALYDKKFGYYTKNNPFGKTGDFITSPIISPLFSEMIFIWVVSFWIKIGKPKKISLVELGPGNGIFCKTFCKILEKFPEFKSSITIYLFEKSQKLIRIQKKLIKSENVKWINDLNEIKSGPIIFFGNEFFDAIPIKQFEIKDSIIYEKYIELDKGKFKKFHFKKASKKLVEELKNLDLVKKFKFIEYPQRGVNIIRDLVKKIIKYKGGILLIDYGYLEPEGKDTLQSLMLHKKNEYFNNIGKADITYLVNFQLLKKIFKNNNLSLNSIVNQNFFLKKMGIIERANIISKKMSFKEKADLYYRLERLLSEKKMGKLFKFIFASNKKSKFNLGFK